MKETEFFIIFLSTNYKLFPSFISLQFYEDISIAYQLSQYSNEILQKTKTHQFNQSLRYASIPK